MKATAGLIEWLNMVRRIAYYQVRVAVESGQLEKPDFCSRCGIAHDYLEAHHADYSKPLAVEWFCCSCHKKEHSKLMKAYQAAWPKMSGVFYEYGTLTPTNTQIDNTVKQAIDSLERALKKQNAHRPVCVM